MSASFPVNTESETNDLTNPYKVRSPHERWKPTSLKDKNKLVFPPLVEEARKRVAKWRSQGYPDTTATTRTLLTHWFETIHEIDTTKGLASFQYYFGQREAVETVVFLYEVAKWRDALSLLKHLDTDGYIRPKDMSEEWVRYVLKLATGTGKTKVLSLLIAWSYFNHKYESQMDYPNNFLLIAPNLIVLDRLLEDFRASKIFHSDPIFPEDGIEGRAWRQDFQLSVHEGKNISTISDLGNLFVTNVHKLHTNRDVPPSLDDPNTKNFFLGKSAVTKTTDDSLNLRTLAGELPNLMVLNDEAHHIHDEKLEWFKSIEELASLYLAEDKKAPFLQIDVTATPKNEKGGIFPRVVADYPLVEAIQHRVVKRLVKPSESGGVRTDRVEENLSSNDYIEKYMEFINAGISSLETQSMEPLLNGKKPVLFIMTEDTKSCDAVENYITNTYPQYKEATLTIHTAKTDSPEALKKLRKASIEIDDPTNPIRIVISVMMLREGWDVKNVTTIVGIRSFGAKNKILPEQAIGRGLRRMERGEDSFDEKLTVIGTPAFIEFVEQLKSEGVILEMPVESDKREYIEVDHEKDLDVLDIPLPQLPAIYQYTQDASKWHSIRFSIPHTSKKIYSPFSSASPSKSVETFN